MDFHLGPVVLCYFLLWFEVIFLQNHIAEKRIYKHFCSKTNDSFQSLHFKRCYFHNEFLGAAEASFELFIAVFLFETLSHLKALVGLGW